MAEFKMPSVTIAKAVFGTIIALLLGCLFPLILTIELSLLMPMLLVTNIALPVIFVASGKFAALALIIAEMASTIFFLGDTIGIMMLLTSVVPGIVVIWGISRRRHFFEQMQTGLIAHFLGLIAAVSVAYFNFGGDMIQKFIDSMREQVALIPDELFMPIVQSVNDMIASLSGEAASPDMMITVESYRSVLAGTMMDVMQRMYVEYLPGCLLTGAVITGLVSVLWGNWRMARKGLATNESFIGMSCWQIPVHLSVGVFFIWIVGAVISGSGAYSAGNTVYTAIYMLVQMTFYVQALSGFDRMLIGRFMGLRGRRILIFLALIGAMIIPFINVVLFVYGGGSMVMNIIHVAKDAIKKKMDEDDNNSDNM